MLKHRSATRRLQRQTISLMEAQRLDALRETTMKQEVKQRHTELKNAMEKSRQLQERGKKFLQESLAR